MNKKDRDALVSELHNAYMRGFHAGAAGKTGARLFSHENASFERGWRDGLNALSRAHVAAASNAEEVVDS